MEFGRNVVMPDCRLHEISVLLVKTGHILGSETLGLRVEPRGGTVLMIADVVEVSAKLGLCGGVMH